MACGLKMTRRVLDPSLVIILSVPVSEHKVLSKVKYARTNTWSRKSNLIFHLFLSALYPFIIHTI